MDRVLIVGTKDVLEPAINALHEMNLVHLEDYVEEEGYFKIGKPLNVVTSLSEKLLKLRSIKSYLGTKDKPIATEAREKVLRDVDKYLGDLDASVSKKTTERSTLESELKELNRREELLKPYVALDLRPELLGGYENVAVFVGMAPGDLASTVQAITPDYEIFSANYENGRVTAVFVPKAVGPKVSEALLKGGFVEIEPTRDTGDPSAAVKAIESRKAEIKSRVAAIDKELKSLNDEFSKFILASEELLSIDTQKAEAPLRFATSDNTFVVDGWVPVNDFEKLKAGMAKATGDRVFVTKIEPEPEKYEREHVADSDKHLVHHEVNAPVKYNNPAYMGPLQAFIDLYSRPKYNEIDPTILFFIGFPIFYGFILGDVGYGLLLLIIGIVLMRVLKHSPGFQILTKTLLMCATSSIIFGILFGEFLGFTLSHHEVVGEGGHVELVKDVLYNYYPHDLTIGSIGPFSLPLERLVPGGFSHELAGSYVFGIKDLLLLTCLIGIIHLTLGLLLGLRNETVQHGLVTAVKHKLSWLLLLWGGLLMIWYVFPLMIAGDMGAISLTNPLFIIGAVLFLIGFILLLMGEGIYGILEVPSLLSNTLSYTRLLAVGMSSVGIAFAVNKMVTMMMPADLSSISLIGILGLIGAVLVFLLGHGINLVLGIIAPGLHALRLHYVEFFQKFYKGGGRIYDPFGYIRKYTEE
jgi:V/A-type H+-transporting ATPase subunit I